MLIKINNRQWIESKEIYLIDNDEYKTDELLVYIYQHPKIPIIIKGDKDIKVFTKKVNDIMAKDRDKEMETITDANDSRLFEQMVDQLESDPRN